MKRNRHARWRSWRRWCGGVIIKSESIDWADLLGLHTPKRFVTYHIILKVVLNCRRLSSAYLAVIIQQTREALG